MAETNSGAMGEKKVMRIMTNDLDEPYYGPEEAWWVLNQEAERSKEIPGRPEHFIIRGQLVRKLAWAE